MAIICKTKKMASKLYDELSKYRNMSLLDIKNKGVKKGIVISDVGLVKGLEFDKVIVYGVNKKNVIKEIDRNYLYIAASRAINELTIMGDSTLLSLNTFSNNKEF
jgi:DNA helicase-2/ATP-dependent DNA helicase PcrA